MLPGSERQGCLLEQIDGQRQVTNWFTIHHGTREVVLEPRGHWATVRLERQVAKATILVEGWPDMDPIEVGRFTEPGERRVFIADGTRSIHVDLIPKARVTFPPNQTEMVVR